LEKLTHAIMVQEGKARERDEAKTKRLLQRSIFGGRPEQVSALDIHDHSGGLVTIAT
jgi:hypothetical protein